MRYKRIATFAAGVLALGLATACGSNGSGDAETNATTSPEETAAQTTNPDEPGFTNVLGGIGDTAVSEGVTLTVRDIAETTTIEVKENPLPDAPVTTEQVQPGRKIIEVYTTVENTGRTPWDLTCGQSVQVVLSDEQGRLHFPTRNAHLTPGNPECNNMLNPGIETEMAWRFEMSEDAAPTFFGFADPQIDPENPYYITLSQ